VGRKVRDETHGLVSTMRGCTVCGIIGADARPNWQEMRASGNSRERMDQVANLPVDPNGHPNSSASLSSVSLSFGFLTRSRNAALNRFYLSSNSSERAASRNF
jgi:hypothetical protein